MDAKKDDPTKRDPSPEDLHIIKQLKEEYGFVPNVFEACTYKKEALSDYRHLQKRETTLCSKEKEVICLLVSEINSNAYGIAKHTSVGKRLGFTEGQLSEIRKGRAPWDTKLDALVKFVESAVAFRSQPSSESIEALFEAGYDRTNLVDIVIAIGDGMINDFLFGAFKFSIDFPQSVEFSIN
jgi:AhpD family alkylhydroperoxidase